MLRKDIEDTVQLRRHLGRASENGHQCIDTANPTWKFFSFQPFFPRNRTTTSESSSGAALSIQPVISSRAASRTFQFESPRSVAYWAGIISAARASASSGVCLNLKESKAPGAAGGGALPGLPVAAGANFLTASAADGAASASTGAFFA